MGDYMLLTWVTCIFFISWTRGMFICGSVIFSFLFGNCYLGSCKSWRGQRRTAGICLTFP